MATRSLRNGKERGPVVLCTVEQVAHVRQLRGQLGPFIINPSGNLPRKPASLRLGVRVDLGRPLAPLRAQHA